MLVTFPTWKSLLLWPLLLNHIWENCPNPLPNQHRLTCSSDIKPKGLWRPTTWRCTFIFHIMAAELHFNTRFNTMISELLQVKLTWRGYSCQQSVEMSNRIHQIILELLGALSILRHTHGHTGGCEYISYLRNVGAGRENHLRRPETRNDTCDAPFAALHQAQDGALVDFTRRLNPSLVSL